MIILKKKVQEQQLKENQQIDQIRQLVTKLLADSFTGNLDQDLRIANALGKAIGTAVDQAVESFKYKTTSADPLASILLKGKIMTSFMHFKA